jgi:hypothetical protein
MEEWQIYRLTGDALGALGKNEQPGERAEISARARRGEVQPHVLPSSIIAIQFC